MEAFSFRRMMLFCRLQMVEMYGRNIGRTLRVGAAAVLVICLFSLIFGEEGESVSVSVAERMMVACSFVASVAFFSDLVACRMMVPASPAEKYVSVFVNSLLLSVMFLALSVLVGSAFFTLLSFFNEPSLTLLYFREGFDASGLVGAMFMLPLIIWVLLYSRSASKRRHSKLVFFGQLAGLVCFLLFPTVLRALGIIDRPSARIVTACVSLSLMLIFIVQSYRLFRRLEMDVREND